MNLRCCGLLLSIDHSPGYYSPQNAVDEKNVLRAVPLFPKKDVQTARKSIHQIGKILDEAPKMFTYIDQTP